MIREMITTKDGLIILSDDCLHKLSKSQQFQYQVQKTSDYGTSNPIVARMGPQVKELCGFYKLTELQKNELIEIMHNKICRCCLECWDIFTRLENEIVNIDNEIGMNGIDLQSNNRVITLPSVPNLKEDAETFLYKAKLSLSKLSHFLGG